MHAQQTSLQLPLTVTMKCCDPSWRVCVNFTRVSHSGQEHLPTTAGLQEHLPVTAGLQEHLPMTAGLQGTFAGDFWTAGNICRPDSKYLPATVGLRRTFACGCRPAENICRWLPECRYLPATVGLRVTRQAFQASCGQNTARVRALPIRRQRQQTAAMAAAANNSNGSSSKQQQWQRQ